MISKIDMYFFLNTVVTTSHLFQPIERAFCLRWAEPEEIKQFRKDVNAFCTHVRADNEWNMLVFILKFKRHLGWIFYKCERFCFVGVGIVTF